MVADFDRPARFAKDTHRRRRNLQGGEQRMKWEVRPLEPDGWGIFLMQKFCKTDEPVCYARSASKEAAERMVKRMNEG